MNHLPDFQLRLSVIVLGRVPVFQQLFCTLCAGEAQLAFRQHGHQIPCVASEKFSGDFVAEMVRRRKVPL